MDDAQGDGGGGSKGSKPALRRGPLAAALSRWRLVPAAALVALAVARLVAVAKSVSPEKLLAKDFLQDYLLVRALLDGLNPYERVDVLAERLMGLKDSEAFAFPLPTPHPPGVSILFLPLGWLDYRAALYVFLLLNIAATAVIVLYLSRLFESSRSASVAAPAVWIALVLFASRPFTSNLTLCNLSLLVLFCIIEMLRALSAQSPLRAGCWWGIALSMKLAGLLLVPFYVWRGEWRLLGAAATVFAALQVAFVLGAGIDAQREYYATVAPANVEAYSGYVLNLSFRNFVEKALSGTRDVNLLPRLSADPLVSAPILVAPVAALLIVLVCGAGLFAARSLSNPVHLAAYLWALSICVSPIVWDHSFLQAVPACALAWAMSAEPRPRAGAVIGTTLLAFGYLRLGSSAFTTSSSLVPHLIPWFGLLLVLRALAGRSSAQTALNAP